MNRPVLADSSVTSYVAEYSLLYHEMAALQTNQNYSAGSEVGRDYT